MSRIQKLVAVIVAIVVAGGLLTVAVLFSLGPEFVRSMATETETRAVIEDVAGLTFEVTYTNEDTLAKSEFISVYARSPGSTQRKRLLFQYDPGGGRTPNPDVIQLDGRTVLIHVDGASSILCESPRSDGIAFKYRVDHIVYPTDFGECR